MKNQFDINKLIKTGKIRNELELERASLAERKLKIESKKNPKLKEKRQALREIIYAYEKQNWSNRKKISRKQINESDIAEKLVFNEIKFFESRKKLITNKLKKLGLNQQEFGKILGHNSKSYTSELMNGIVPFSLKDLIVISKLLKINLTKLVPTDIPEADKSKIEANIKKIDKPKLKLNKEEFAFS